MTEERKYTENPHHALPIYLYFHLWLDFNVVSCFFPSSLHFIFCLFVLFFPPSLLCSFFRILNLVFQLRVFLLSPPPPSFNVSVYFPSFLPARVLLSLLLSPTLAFFLFNGPSAALLWLTLSQFTLGGRVFVSTIPTSLTCRAFNSVTQSRLGVGDH